ncbi:MAG: hypothetical protein ACREBJ_11075 [Nitrosotalea sp.]
MTKRNVRNYGKLKRLVVGTGHVEGAETTYVNNMPSYSIIHIRMNHPEDSTNFDKLPEEQENVKIVFERKKERNEKV